MTIHPKIAEFLKSLPEPDGSPLDPVAMRAGENAQVPPVADRLPIHDVREATAATSSGDVPVRIYTPAEAESYGVLVYFHGGAFFSGSLETHDHIARSLAKETGLEVVAVDFRLAPEHEFPAGLEDCYRVVRWVAENSGELKWDGRTLAIAGDSSGGNFVAAVVAKARDDGFDRITHQILYYPSLDLDFDVDRYPSLRENAEGYGLETGILEPFNAFYFESGADRSDPLVSPIKREDLSGLPTALIVTAEHDPLRDEGELYGKRLQEAGVNATVSRYDGANHGFVQHFSWIPEFQRVFTETAEFLRRS
ncbi:alpha/beta hydrolase [Kocuria sp. WRN011]|uniref:Alpha/beta hydrolase n=1 Tax=Kocuria carniphila TaxID=262208 RepID=A0ABV3V5B5_9MICC|nr:alpha/beta hydrolase [Kocuria sp. WRN011]PBB07336.1 alpha/beta hydrolase [Kocuria sp. WRN011]